MATKALRFVTVAIYIGTTYAGCAYSLTCDYKTDPRNIQCIPELCSDGLSFKIPTFILLKLDRYGGDFKTVECGGMAERIYSELNADERGEYELVEGFEIKSAAMRIQCDSELTLSQGKRIQMVRLFSIFIDYLKKRFHDAIDKSGYSLKKSGVTWVLSVPTIFAKQFTRTAAEKAGIDSSQLQIALEPEAVTLSCVHLSDPTGTDEERLDTIGTKFLLIDTRDGTVHYIILQVSHDNNIDIIRDDSRGHCGGTTVENRLYDVLKDIFGTDVFGVFEKSHPDDFLEFKKEYKAKMRDFTADTPSLEIRVPLALIEIYQQQKRIQIGRAATKYGSKVRIVTNRIWIDATLLKPIFDECCEQIVRYTLDNLYKSGNVNAILLVGCFGGWNIIRERVTIFYPNIRIITPDEPELSVLLGALFYGHNPRIVK